MKTSKIKSSVFGLAFFGSMVFGGINSHAQESVEPGEGSGCFARIVQCGGDYNAYHCDKERTGNRCGTYDKDSYFC